jgi:AcrR family transcriptional regulator
MKSTRSQKTVSPKAVARNTATPQSRGDAFVHTVLKAALAQLADVGYGRLSIPDVAAQAGVNKTSIYRRWPGKAELVREALSTAMQHADNPPDTGALRTDLIELARTVAAFMQTPVGTALIRIMLADGGNAELRALATSAYREAGKHGPREVLSRAKARGELSDDVDPPLMLFTIAGAILHRVFVEQRTASAPFIKQVVDLVLNGASAKSKPK